MSAGGSVKLDYAIVGERSRPALVLIRGIGAQRVRWSPRLIGLLAEGGLSVITFDHRDTGKSTHFTGVPTPTMSELIAALSGGKPMAPAYTLGDMAGDVLSLLDQLEIERADVFGMSMGSYIGQVLAARYPQRVRTLVCAMASHRLPSMEAMSPQMRELSMRGPLGTDERALLDYDLEFAALGAGNMFPIDHAFLESVLKLERVRGVAPGGYVRHVMAMMAAGDRSELCRSIPVPSLVVHGTADPIVPHREAVELAHLLPHGRLFSIDGAGHDITPGMLPALVPAVLDFVRQEASSCR